MSLLPIAALTQKCQGTIYNLRVSKRVRSIKSISTFVERKQLSEYI